MKITAADFGKFVRKVVREELERALPTAINEVLSEKYMRRLVQENIGSARRNGSSLSEVLSADDEGPEDQNETPEPLRNSSKGIYSTSPLTRGKEDAGNIDESRRRELLNKVFGDGVPDFFEGTKPVAGEQKGGAMLGETQQRFGAEGVPTDMLAKLGVNFERMSETIERTAKPSSTEVPDDDHPTMKALARKRAALEKPVNAGNDWKR
jgi:hypothetical protein